MPNEADLFAIVGRTAAWLCTWLMRATMALQAAILGIACTMQHYRLTLYFVQIFEQDAVLHCNASCSASHNDHARFEPTAPRVATRSARGWTGSGFGTTAHNLTLYSPTL